MGKPVQLGAGDVPQGGRGTAMAPEISIPSQSNRDFSPLPQERRLRDAIRFAPVAIVCLDAQGVITLVNEAFSRIVGRPEAELVGRSWEDFLLPAWRGQVASQLRAALAGETALRVEAPLVTAGGQCRLLSWHCTPLADETASAWELLCVGQDVTEQRSAEVAARESQRALNTLLSNLPGMAYRCAFDAEYTMEFVSEGCLPLTGYPAEAILHNRELSFKDLILPEDRDYVWKTVDAQVSAGEPFELVYRIRTAAGTVRWVWEKGRGVANADGTVIALEGFVQDITEPHTMRERVRQTLEQMPIPLEGFDADGNAIMANRAFRDLVGFDSSEQIVGRHNLLRDPIIQQMGLQEQVARVFAGETVSNLEVRIPLDAIADRCGTRRRGEIVAQATMFPVVGSEGDVERVVTIWQDVTEQRRALEELRLRDLALASASSAIFIAHGDGRITYANHAAEAIFGYTAAEFNQMRFADLWAPGPEAEPAHRAAATRQAWRGELRGLRRSGDNFEAGLTLSWASEDAMLAIVNDITERKRARDALLESERRFREMADMLPDAVLEFDCDYTITYVNRSATNLLNQIRPGTGVGSSVMDVLSPADMYRAREALDRIAATGEPLETCYSFARPGQAYLPAEIHVSRLTDLDGACSGWRAVLHDASDRERIAQEQRLAAVGHLAAGVAHEFNNLLASMSGRAQLAEAIGTPEAHRALVETVLMATRRGAKICRNLISFARPREPERHRVYVHQALDAALAMAAREVENRGITVERDYRDTHRPVLADSSQIEQVMLNLILNACQAMPDGGTLTVATRFEPNEEGGEVVATVRDTGVGISAEDMPHIFEPFFTSRGPKSGGHGGGSGLGLSVSHGIITAHGGTLTAHSVLGSGATFEVRLKACPDGVCAEAAPVPSQVPRVAPGHGHRVLVAEDEPDVREVICRVLEDRGYQVTAAATTEEAMAALKSDDVHAVVSDLVMPGGGGRRILQMVRGLPRPVPVLLITGMPQEALEEELLNSGACAYLPKPFGLADLALALNRILGG